MYQPIREPMKHRFKDKWIWPWKYRKDEFHFDDDISDYGGTNKELKRENCKRNNGQKPKRRARQKFMQRSE